MEVTLLKRKLVLHNRSLSFKKASIEKTRPTNTNPVGVSIIYSYVFHLYSSLILGLCSSSGL
jgi:hypothetical protein